MSRASGAGAYSHGIACPSPNPQLFGRWSLAGTRLVLVRSGMNGIMAPPAPDPSAVVGRDRVHALAVADVQVIVVPGELPRQPFLDEDRIVEVDQLDVAWRGGSDRADQVARRGAVVR